jgi:hypothetical protein
MSGVIEWPRELRQRRIPGWRCTTCGEFITRIEDGRVEWLAGEEEGSATLRGLRLVHRREASPKSGGCQYDMRKEFRRNRSIVEGLSLERFVGPDGLMLLLSMIASGESSAEEIIELVKRVQIPGYEQARELFEIAIENGFLSPSIGNGFYLQSEIQALLRWAASGA